MSRRQCSAHGPLPWGRSRPSGRERAIYNVQERRIAQAQEIVSAAFYKLHVDVTGHAMDPVGPAWFHALGAPDGKRHRACDHLTGQVAVAMCKPDRGETRLEGFGGDQETDGVDLGRHRL
jgi:hypothetical protein